MASLLSALSDTCLRAAYNRTTTATTNRRAEHQDRAASDCRRHPLADEDRRLRQAGELDRAAVRHDRRDGGGGVVFGGGGLLA
jgi:hypothetical protein